MYCQELNMAGNQRLTATRKVAARKSPESHVVCDSSRLLDFIFMGLGIVLIFWVVVGTVLACVGAIALAGLTALLTRGVHAGRRRAIVITALFPFLCFGWGGCVFVLQAVVNEGLLHRDLGIGDTWHAPLPNGYQIMMIDVTDQGWVYNPRTQGSDSAVGEQGDAVSGVRNLQVSGRYIFGDSDSKSFEHAGQETNQVDSYFILDTQTGKRTELKTYDDLRSRARDMNVSLNLEPINTVYARFRSTWFDLCAALLFFVPPLLGFSFLIVWIWRLRRTRLSDTVVAPS